MKNNPVFFTPSLKTGQMAMPKYYLSGKFFSLQMYENIFKIKFLIQIGNFKHTIFLYT